MAEIVTHDDLTVTEHLCDPLWQVTLWPGVSHDSLPAEPGRIADGVARIGPRVWIGFEGEPPGIATDDGATLDIAHSRKRFRIEGDRARDVVMRLAPLDFRDSAFPDGAIKATAAHHMSVWIARDGAAWDVYVGYTFAGVMRELLEETAAQWEAA